MAFTSADLASIDTAIATGAVEVRFQDRTVKYNNTQGLILARSLIYAELHPANTSPAITRQVRIHTCKGL